MGVSIAQWIRIHLPSCRPGFESKAHYAFVNLYNWFVSYKLDDNKQKEAGIGPF